MSKQTSGKKLSRTGSAHTNLPLQPLLVVVEEAEAVELVLWRRVAGMTASAARFVFGFRSRRWSLIPTEGKDPKHF